MLLVEVKVGDGKDEKRHWLFNGSLYQMERLAERRGLDVVRHIELKEDLAAIAAKYFGWLDSKQSE